MGDRARAHRVGRDAGGGGATRSARGDGARAGAPLQSLARRGVLPSPRGRDRARPRVRRVRRREHRAAGLGRARSRRVARGARRRATVLLAPRAQSTGRRFVNTGVWGRGLAGRRVAGMLARRLIPCLDVAGGRVVKGVRFQELRDAGDPVEQAARYDAEGADELVFLDIAASHEERGTLIELVSRVADRLFVPFTVGGGIRSVADAQQVLRAGADKVAVNTAAVRDPALVTRLADAFGRQCVVAALDVKRNAGRLEVVVRGGREPTGLAARSEERRVGKEGRARG